MTTVAEKLNLEIYFVVIRVYIRLYFVVIRVYIVATSHRWLVATILDDKILENKVTLDRARETMF